MMTILSCLSDHDPRLVALAAVVCALGSWISVQVLARANDDRSASSLWPYLAGVAFGASIWATHFIAMLAFLPASGGYEPGMTTLSLIIAVTTSMAGFVLATLVRARTALVGGGAVVGLGIASMHYLGMHAISSSGFVGWNPQLVAVSVINGLAFSTIAIVLVRKNRMFSAALALVLAICGVHFTGMSAATFQPIGAASGPLLMNQGALAAAVSIVTGMIIGAGLLATLIDKRAARDAGTQMRTLADAAIEGLVLVENGQIIRCNRSLTQLSGYADHEIAGRQFNDLIADVAPHLQTEMRAKHVLRRVDGRDVPIELLSNASGNLIIYAVRDLREKLSTEARIHYLAHHDALTGLPNRVTFLERLDAMLNTSVEPADEIAVLGLDLDRFKEVNDVYGHAMGDAVLVEVAARMRALLREGEYLARVGGDEFVAIQTGGQQPADANDLCNRLIAAATQPVAIENNRVQLGLSIGVSVYPKDGRSSSELLANADLAMYRAKESNAMTACFFSSDMDDSVRQRRALARDLRDALAREELELFYQVQTSIASSQIVGYEVLLRWNHPQRGMIAPSEFIPIAEETGLILSIGEWVIRKACRDAAGWPAPYRVAVNVSGVQFSQGDLPAIVHAALIDSGLAPVRLELEITESVLISDMSRTLSTLRRLKALGISIAMDDFGTGYSSLSTLRAFPFDKIKIDRSFVDQVETQPQARSIVRAILALGRSLDIPVLAEGVETTEHLRFLRDEGCDEAQGYLLGRPRPLSHIATLDNACTVAV